MCNNMNFSLDICRKFFDKFWDQKNKVNNKIVDLYPYSLSLLNYRFFILLKTATKKEVVNHFLNLNKIMLLHKKLPF